MRPRDVLFTFVVLLAVPRVGAAQQPRADDAEALTLSAAIDQALRQSPRLRPAEDTRARAEIQRRVAEARLLRMRRHQHARPRPRASR